MIVQPTEFCSDTSIAILTNINVNPKPKAAFSFSPREVSLFDANITIANSSSDILSGLAFDFGDGTSSLFPQNVHTYNNFGNFLITETVMNSFGCADTVSDVIKILPEFRYWMPNTFTPDDNGRNDFFMPVTVGIVDYEFEVYTRWGEKIFRTTNSSEGWNGSFKGQPSPQGVYAWKLTFKNLVTEEKETHAGLVSLFRNPW